MERSHKDDYFMWTQESLVDDTFLLHCSEHGCLGSFTNSEPAGKILIAHIDSEHDGRAFRVVVR